MLILKRTKLAGRTSVEVLSGGAHKTSPYAEDLHVIVQHPGDFGLVLPLLKRRFPSISFTEGQFWHVSNAMKYAVVALAGSLGMDLSTLADSLGGRSEADLYAGAGFVVMVIGTFAIIFPPVRDWWTEGKKGECKPDGE